VVYDSVGKDTFEVSLKCLRPLGLLVSFGNASGPVPPVDLTLLAQHGSLFITRPTLATYIAERSDLVSAAQELFDMVLGGTVRIDINQRYHLKNAAHAQRDLEARITTGSSILLPSD
jgi:NADPH2:quinone reductase